MKQNNSETIKRARELAELRLNATPGPWVLFAVDDGWHINQQGGPGFVGTMPIYLHRSEQCYANAQLVAAAQEMAELLERLTNRLEEIDKWARSVCAATCKDWPPGKHAQNCPIVDLGVEPEGDEAHKQSRGPDDIYDEPLDENCWGAGTR